jgi:hypothetical protein
LIQQIAGFTVQPTFISQFRRLIEQVNFRACGVKTPVGKAALVPIAAVPIAAVPIAAVAIAAVPIAAVPIAAVPIAAVPIAAVPIAAVAIAAVPIAAVPIAAVPIAAVPIAAVAIAAVHNFKQFSPRDFTHDFQLVSTTFILIFRNRAISNHFRNLIFRIKEIIIEAISRLFTEVHTFITYGRGNIFFKFAGASVRFVSASPIRIKHFKTFNNSCFTHFSYPHFLPSSNFI